MIAKRLATLQKRKKKASELGFKFNRAASFRVPSEIKIGNQRKRLFFPDEDGVKVAFVDLLLDDCYGCDLLARRREKIDTVLDIGGNVGIFGVAARIAFPGAVIHSYEPNPKIEKYLSYQAKSVNFTYFMEAVGSENGMVSLDFPGDSVQTRSRKDINGKIPQISFSKAIKRIGGHVDLLKMDCEGAEWEIFEETESWKRVNNLTMEYHLFESGATEQKLLEKVEDLGFDVSQFSPAGDFGLLFARRKYESGGFK